MTTTIDSPRLFKGTQAAADPPNRSPVETAFQCNLTVVTRQAQVAEARMSAQQIIEAIIGAVIAFIVPATLNQFWPPQNIIDSLPRMKWCVAGLIGDALGIEASVLLGFAGLSGAGLGSWAIFGALIGLFQ